MNDDSPRSPSRPPHPLAIALIERLRPRPGAPVLEIGRGSGRNAAALESAGFGVVSLEDAGPASCAAALSSHALLHGTAASVDAMLDRIARALEPGAPFYATFGSTSDARYGKGTAIEPHVFSPVGGDEDGVAHMYFDRARLTRLLERRFVIESLEERDVDQIAGRWAHEQRPLEAAVHWFALLARNDQ